LARFVLNATMNIQALGHIVLKVQELSRSIRFYETTLGLRLVARAEIRGTPMAFFAISGNHNHHDLALTELGPQAKTPGPSATGLAHFALKIGDSLSQLRAAREQLRAAAVAVDRTIDHQVAQSLYICDPDGHVIELYVDADPRIWADDPTSVAHSDPFEL
jgi:catechol 2,3-dioxygenase